MSAKSLGIIGAAMTKGQVLMGMDLGPKALRDGGMVQKLTDIHWKVTDYGDVPLEALEGDDPAVHNTKNPRNVGSASKKIADRVEEVLVTEGTCAVLGGDRSMAIGSLAGHARVNPNMAVLWIDAHPDIKTPLTSKNGNMHGMPLSFLVKEFKPYVPDLPGFEWLQPCVSVKDIALIGVRKVIDGERKLIEEYNVPCFSMHDIDKYGISSVVEKALKAIDPEGNKPIHVSFDADSIDPMYTPSVGWPVPGGLSLREAYYIAEEVGRTGRVAMVDITEINPLIGGSRDRDTTIDTMTNVVQRIFGNWREGIYPPGYQVPRTADVDR